MEIVIKIPDKMYEDAKNGNDIGESWFITQTIKNGIPYEPKGEYEIACNVLLSLEQIVRKSDGWEDSAVEAVHNAVQTAIKCMHDRPQGEWKLDSIGVYCNQCNMHPDYSSSFCPNCGAEMKGRFVE